MTIQVAVIANCEARSRKQSRGKRLNLDCFVVHFDRFDRLTDHRFDRLTDHRFDRLTDHRFDRLTDHRLNASPPYNEEVVMAHIIWLSGLLRSARNDGDLNRHHTFWRGINHMLGATNDGADIPVFHNCHDTTDFFFAFVFKNHTPTIAATNSARPMTGR